MARVSALVNTADVLIAQAAAWYQTEQNDAAAFEHLPPALVEASLKLAEGDYHRMVINDTTSITVYNYRVW